MLGLRVRKKLKRWGKAKPPSDGEGCGERLPGLSSASEGPLRTAMSEWPDRRGVVLMEITTDYSVNSKLLSNLVAKESAQTLQFGQSSPATSSVAREISRDEVRNHLRTHEFAVA
jgi:hypothetical protein